MAGGYTAGGPVITDAAELYVPEVDAWFTAASMHEIRDQAVVVRLLDGRVLVAGGRSPARTAINRAEVFDRSGN